MNLANNLQQFMIKQATSEKDLAQTAEELAKAKAKEKKRKIKQKKIDANKAYLRQALGPGTGAGPPSYGKRFLRGAAVGALPGAILGGVRGYQADQDGPVGTVGGALGGALGGAAAGGLGNMLAAYLQGDMYDAIAASK